jgi:hypothetical protein
MSAKDVLTSVVAGAARVREAAVDVSESKGAVPLWAAFRQGGNEMGQALKAFPDSIQASPELGGIGTATQREVSDAKLADHPPLDQPGEPDMDRD